MAYKITKPEASASSSSSCLPPSSSSSLSSTSPAIPTAAVSHLQAAVRLVQEAQTLHQSTSQAEEAASGEPSLPRPPASSANHEKNGVPSLSSSIAGNSAARSNSSMMMMGLIKGAGTAAGDAAATLLNSHYEHTHLRIAHLCHSALRHLDACGLPSTNLNNQRRGTALVSSSTGETFSHDVVSNTGKGAGGAGASSSSSSSSLLTARDASKGCLLGFQCLVLLAEAMRALGRDREAIGCYTESFNWISEAMPVRQRARALYRAASVMLDFRGSLEKKRLLRWESETNQSTPGSRDGVVHTPDTTGGSGVSRPTPTSGGGRGRKKKVKASAVSTSSSPSQEDPSSRSEKNVGEAGSSSFSATGEEGDRTKSPHNNALSDRKASSSSSSLLLPFRCCSRIHLASILSPCRRPVLSITDGESLRYCRRALEYVLLLQPGHLGASVRLLKVLLLLGDFGEAASALEHILRLGDDRGRRRTSSALSSSFSSSSESLVLGARKVRWLLRALRREKEAVLEDVLSKQQENLKRGEKRGAKTGEDKPTEDDLGGGEADEDGDVEQEFLSKDKQRIKRQLEELKKEDKAALEWARPGAERKLSLSLPYLSCSSSSCSIQNPIEGALQILAFLNALLVTVYASFAADEQRESSDTTLVLLPTCATQVITVSPASHLLSVPSHLVSHLERASLLTEGSARHISGSSTAHHHHHHSSRGSCSSGSASPVSRVSPPASSPSPSFRSVPANRSTTAALSSSSSTAPVTASSSSSSSSPENEREKKGSVEGGESARGLRESAQSRSLPLPSPYGGRKRPSSCIGRTQQQQRQLLLLQQNQQRSRNRLRQEKPRRLKFLHECDSVTSNIPFAFWRAFGHLMRVPHTHVPSCAPFTSYEHMDALEQLWGDATALAHLRSSGLSYKILHANAQAAAVALAGTSSHSSSSSSSSLSRGEGNPNEGGIAGGRRTTASGSSSSSKARGPRNGSSSSSSSSTTTAGGGGGRPGASPSSSGGGTEAPPTHDKTSTPEPVVVLVEEEEEGEREREAGEQGGLEATSSSKRDGERKKKAQRTGGVVTRDGEESESQHKGKTPSSSGGVTLSLSSPSSSSPGSSSTSAGGLGLSQTGKTSAAMAAARGAIQGVIAAATGVAGAAAHGPSFQWVLWQLQSAMENVEPLLTSDASGDTTPCAGGAHEGQGKQETLEGLKSPADEQQQQRGARQPPQQSLLLLSCEAQRHVVKAIEERLGLPTAPEDKREGSVHLELLSVLMRVVEALISTRSYWQAPAYPSSSSSQASLFSSSSSQSSLSQDPSPCILLLPENGKIPTSSSFSTTSPRVYTPLALSTFVCAFICEAMRCFSSVASTISQLSLQSISTTSDKTKGSSPWASPHSLQTTVKVETVAHSSSSVFSSPTCFSAKDLAKVGIWRTSTWSALYQVAQESKYEGTPLGRCAKVVCQWFTQLDFAGKKEREENEGNSSSSLSFSPSFLFDVALCLLSGAAASSPYLLSQRPEDLQTPPPKESFQEKTEGGKRKEDEKKIEEKKGSPAKGIRKKAESASRLTLLTIDAFQLKQMEELLEVGGACIYSAVACYDGRGEEPSLCQQGVKNKEKKEQDEGKRKKTTLSSKTSNSEEGVSTEVVERRKKNEVNDFNFRMKKLLAWLALLQRQLAGALAAEGKVSAETVGSWCLSPLSTDNGEGAIAALAALALLDELSQDPADHAEQDRFLLSSGEERPHAKGFTSSPVVTEKGDNNKETSEETSKSSSSSSSRGEKGEEREDVVGRMSRGGAVSEWGPSLSLLRRKAIAAVVSEGIDIQTLTTLRSHRRPSSSSASFTASSLIASVGRGEQQEQQLLDDDQATQTQQGGEDSRKNDPDSEEKSSSCSSSSQRGEGETLSKDKAPTDSALSSTQSSPGLEKDQRNLVASSSSEEETGRTGEPTWKERETAEALILDALVETLKEEELHLISLASRVQEQAQRYTSEEPTASLSAGGGGGGGGLSSMNSSFSENDDPSNACLNNGFELLSPDLQADLVYFFHSTIPFLSRVSREATALGASSVAFSSSSIARRSTCRDEERSVSRTGGSKNSTSTSLESPSLSSPRSSSSPTPSMTLPTSLLAVNRPISAGDVSLVARRPENEKRKSTLLSISPILESFFLRLTSLYGDIFSLLALRTSRTLDAPLVSCLGMALNPNYPMEPIRRQRYGVDDSFLLAVTCSLPVFLSCLKVFRHHSHGAGFRESSPCTPSDHLSSSYFSASQGGMVSIPLPSSSYSMAATPANGHATGLAATPPGSGRTSEEGEGTSEKESTSNSRTEGGSSVSPSPSSVIEGDEKKRDVSRPHDRNNPTGLRASSGSAFDDDPREAHRWTGSLREGREAVGNAADSYRPGEASHAVAQQVLPTLDTPFCVWGVAVPPNRSTAKWLVKGQEELQMDQDGDDEEEDDEEDEEEDHSSLFGSTCAPSSAGGTPTANGQEASISPPSPTKRHRQSLSSSQTQGDEDKRSEASVDRPSRLEERRGREDLPDDDFPSSSSTSTTTTATPPAADGCYLHSTASRLCVALGAFILTELVAVSAFCSCCTAAVEKKKFQFLPAAAGTAAVTAGGGAGGAGAAASAALALATMAARRGSAWRDLCFSGQLARWCLHSLLLLIGAPLEAIATGGEEKEETTGSRQGGEREKRLTSGFVEEQPGQDEELHWQLHPLTGVLPVLEDEDSCVMDISCFRDPATPMSTLDEGGGGLHPASAGASGVINPGRAPRASPATPTSSRMRGGVVSETSISTPAGGSLGKGSPSGGRVGSAGGLIGGGGDDPASSLVLDTLSPVSAVLSGALGDAVVGRNEERGALDGGEYAARLGQLVWSALEVEMLVRELGDGAGSSQLEGLMGLATGGERSGAIGSTGGKAILPLESKSKKGERGERAAKAASAAPAPVALVPEWLRNACKEEDELPWERKLSGINVYAPTPRPTTGGGNRSGVMSDRASSLSPASSSSGKRQFPGLELYLPGGVCSSSLPLAALQLCLRVMRISCVRGFEQELLVCASAAVCSSPSSSQRQGGEGEALSPYTLDGPRAHLVENLVESSENFKQEKGGNGGLSAESYKSRASSTSSYVPDAERATTMMTQALRQRMSQTVQEREAEGGGGESEEDTRVNRTSLQTSRYQEEAIAEFAAFTTTSGSNVFLVIPLAARLLQVQRAATAITEEMSFSRAAGVLKPSATVSRKNDMIANTPERKARQDDEDDGTKKSLRKERHGKKWCWAASEVSDRLGDIAHCIACCYFLVYGQPVLRPTPPLDKLVMKTTKEQMRSNFVEGSLPAAILGVYIHRAVQRCAPWATERPSKGKPLSISTFLFPSRETREFGRSAIAASDTLLFNSPSPPEVSVPSYLPPFLHLPSSTCLSPLPFPSPPGVTYSLFWSHAADPLVLPRYLHLFLLLSVQQLQVSQPLQIPLQMQQLLQQQIDGASSSFLSQQELALLRPLPSLRSICNLIEPAKSDEVSGRELSTAPPLGGLAYLSKSISSSPEVSSDQRGKEGVWETGLSSSPYVYSEQTEEDSEVKLRSLAKVEGWKKFIHQANPTSLDVAPLHVYTPYSQHIYKLHRLQTLLLLHFIPSSKHQSLLDAYWPPPSSGGSDPTEPIKSLVSSEEAEGRDASSLTSLPSPLLWYAKSNKGVGVMKEGSRGDGISEKEAKESILSLQELLHERLLYRGKASDHTPSAVHGAPLSSTPDRLPYATVISISRVLAASALSAVGQRPLHGSPPSLRGFSLHLLQLLQQSQRTASTEVEALERVGLAARTAALAPANPSLWTSLACLLLEVVLLLLDKHTAAGGGGLLTGFGGGRDASAFLHNKLFSYMTKGCLEETPPGRLASSLHPNGSSLNTASFNFSGKTAAGGNSRELFRNGVAGGGKSSTGVSMNLMTGKKGTTAAGDPASSTSWMVSVLWRFVGCPGDKAAPCEEILLQLFAHACLVSNLCGEIWLAAMKRFNALKEVNIDVKSRLEMREGKTGTATTVRDIWEKLNVAILPSSWWSKMKQSGKKIDDPAELQWRFVVARLDALLLVVLLWKHFRYTNNQTTGMTSRRPYAAIAADLHRQRWTASGGDSKDKSSCLSIASLFAKAPLGSRGDGGLSELQKLLLRREKNRGEEGELKGGKGGQDHSSTAADSKKTSSKKNTTTSSSQEEEEEEAKQMLAVLESEGEAGQSLSTSTEDYNPSTQRRRDQGYLIAVPTVEDVHALRSFIVEASGLLRFVYDARALPLTAASFHMREGIVSNKTEKETHNETPTSSSSKEETGVSSVDMLSTGGSVEGGKLSGVGKLGGENDEKEVWRWTSTASLSRCKMWVDAETFLWPLPLMRSTWLARLAQWAIRLPDQYKDLGVRGVSQGEITGVLAAVKSVCDELTHAARQSSSETDDEEIKILSKGGMGEGGGAADVVMMNGDENFGRKDEEEKKSNSHEGLPEEGGNEREEGEEKRFCEEDHRLCIASVLYTSALCDASDALMMSCIQAFGAEAMLDPSSVEAEVKDTSERQNKRRKTEKGATRESSSEEEISEREKDPSAVEKEEKEEEAARSLSTNSCEPKKKKKFVSARVSLRHYYEALTDMEELVEADGDVLPLAMPLYHLHALRLKVLVASKGALWKVAALFPWKKSHVGGEKRDGEEQQQEGGDKNTQGDNTRFDKRLDRLIRQYLRGEKDRDIKREVTRLHSSQQSIVSMDHEEHGENQETKEDLDVLKPFSSPADVVADCIEVLQYLALKSRQAGLWTSIPRLLLVDAALISGHASLALRHLRHLYARGCPKLLPPDAWLSNHYQALKQRRPAYDRSKLRLYLATSAAVVLLAKVTLKRTEKKKEEQLTRFRAEDAQEKSGVKGGEGGKGYSSSTSLSAEANTSSVVAGEGWIYGGLEKIETLDEVVQGVKLIVEQLDAQLKLLRRVQLLQLQNELQLALIDDPSSPPRPGSELHSIQSQVLQLQNTQGGPVTGSGGGTGTGSTILDEDAQQTNSEMQAEVVRSLLDGAVTVFETLVLSCPDVLDMREMHRAITQLFPDVGVPEVEPQNTYDGTTASIDGRLLRLLRDAVVAIRGAAPQQPMQLLRKLRSLRTAGGGSVDGLCSMTVDGRDEAEVISIEHGLEELQTRLETAFVMACRKLLYHNPPAPSPSPTEENKDQTAHTTTPTPGVAVMKLSLGLPVRCGMEVQEIEKAKEALAAFGKATRAGAPSMELFVKSGKVSGGGGGESVKKGRPSGTGRGAGQRGGPKGDSAGGQETASAGASQSSPDGPTAAAVADSTQRGAGGAKRGTGGETDAPGAAAPGENKRRKTEEVLKVGETRPPTGPQGAEATSADLECVIEVE